MTGWMTYKGLELPDGPTTDPGDILAEDLKLLADGVGGSVPSTRTISTTAPLQGGGDLSANRTLTVDAATTSAVGVVELATTAEANAGTDTTRAVTASGLLLIKPASPGSAYVGANLTGNTRGSGALDIQSQRGSASVVANGDSSVALGLGNTAAGTNGVAIGVNCTAPSAVVASGNVAMGYGCTASSSALASAAVGRSCSATGIASTAMGYSSTSSGSASAAVGQGNTASGSSSVAMGNANTAAGDSATADGNGNSAAAANSIAVGFSNSAAASGINSVLAGRNNYSTATSFTCVGLGILNNQSGGSISTTTGVISGTIVAGTPGRLSTAVGHLNTTSGIQSIALGYGNTASADNATAIGNAVSNSTANSVELGPNNTNKLRISSSGLTCFEGCNFVLGTSTGSKLGTSTSQKLGFFNATPVVQPTAITVGLTTITYTEPGTPDYAIQNLTNSSPFGFVTQDEGNSVLKVIANLQTRVAELEARLETLGLMAAN